MLDICFDATMYCQFEMEVIHILLFVIAFLILLLATLSAVVWLPLLKL